MTDGEFQKAVLERFEAMDARFDALQGKVDPGLRPGRSSPRPQVLSPHALAQGGRTVRPQARHAVAVHPPQGRGRRPARPAAATECRRRVG